MVEVNKIYNDDCIDVMNRLPDNSIDLIVTDPPYRTTSRGNAGNSGGMFQKEVNKQGKVFAHNNIDISRYASELFRVLKDGSHCYIMTNHVNLQKMINACTDLRTDEEIIKDIKPYGFHFIKSLIWSKGNKIMGTFYMSEFEYILFFRKGKAVKINNCGTSDILKVPNRKTKDLNGENLHDSEKPVELMTILIENSSKKDDLVFDPFMGIGTTAVACINTGRNYIGCELDTTYYQLCVERLENT